MLTKAPKPLKMTEYASINIKNVIVLNTSFIFQFITIITIIC